MLENGNEEAIYARLTETIKPVLKSVEQLLTMMVDFRVSQNELINMKAVATKQDSRLDKLEAAMHTRFDRLESSVQAKADKSDLTALAGLTANNSVSVGKLVGGATVVAIVTSIIIGLILTLVKKP